MPAHYTSTASNIRNLPITPGLLYLFYSDNNHTIINDLTSTDSGLSVWICHCVLPGVGVGARISVSGVVLVRSQPSLPPYIPASREQRLSRHNTGSRLFWASRTSGSCRKDSFELDILIVHQSCFFSLWPENYILSGRGV